MSSSKETTQLVKLTFRAKPIRQKWGQINTSEISLLYLHYSINSFSKVVYIAIPQKKFSLLSTQSPFDPAFRACNLGPCIAITSKSKLGAAVNRLGSCIVTLYVVFAFQSFKIYYECMM